MLNKHSKSTFSSKMNTDLPASIEILPEIERIKMSHEKTEARKQNQTQWQSHTNEVRSLLMLKNNSNKEFRGMPLSKLVN